MSTPDGGLGFDLCLAGFPSSCVECKHKNIAEEIDFGKEEWSGYKVALLALSLMLTEVGLK